MAATTLSPQIYGIIQRALEEDIGSGDATSNSIIPPDATMHGQIIAKENGVVAGLDIVQAVYATFDPTVEFTARIEEGARVENFQVLATAFGSARSLLTVERTALNFLGRMSGIATLTRRFVDAMVGTKAVILDTRKTAPGLRVLDKLAVSRGGGQNHRIGLYDMILIKDNHIDFAGSLEEAVRRVRANYPQGTFGSGGLEIEVEARTLEHVEAALKLRVEQILLDNMSIEMMAEAVRMNKGQAMLEASGNVNLETLQQIAECGVDYISIGALTHSARTLDVSFDYVR